MSVVLAYSKGVGAICALGNQRNTKGKHDMATIKATARSINSYKVACGKAFAAFVKAEGNLSKGLSDAAYKAGAQCGPKADRATFNNDYRPALLAAGKDNGKESSAQTLASNCGLVFLAGVKGIALPAGFTLSKPEALRNALIAAKALPAPVESKPSKGRPKGTTGGKANPAPAMTAKQQPAAQSKGAASPVKALTPSALVDVLRLAGMGDLSGQLAHMILNERPVVVKWLNSMAD